jgi:hypothetical protein
VITKRNNLKSLHSGRLAQVVVNIYGALPFPAKEGTPPNLRYVKQSKTLVFADSPSKMTGHATLKKAQELRGRMEQSRRSVLEFCLIWEE